MSNADLLKNAEEAIDTLYTDMSVTKEKARENLESLRDEIEMDIEALDFE